MGSPSLSTYSCSRARRPEQLADRLVRERELAETLNVDAWLAMELSATLALSDAELAARPGVWKWMFPMGGKSKPGAAPHIGRRKMRELGEADGAIRMALLRSWRRMLAYLGVRDLDDRIEWLSAPPPWVVDGSHDRRISRILRAMRKPACRTRPQC